MLLWSAKTRSRAERCGFRVSAPYVDTRLPFRLSSRMGKKQEGSRLYTGCGLSIALGAVAFFIAGTQAGVVGALIGLAVGLLIGRMKIA